MNTLFSLLTDATCGEACWHAREAVCRCSCGGRNHGCLKTANGVQPVRTAKIDGQIHTLVAVGMRKDVEPEAIRLNEAAGEMFHYAHTNRDFPGPAKMRPATAAQVSKWPELAAFTSHLPEVWRAAHPDAFFYRDYPGLPYLVWLAAK